MLVHRLLAVILPLGFMCGRFTLTKRDLVEVATELEASFAPEDAAAYRPRYNAAPTDHHFLLRFDDGNRRLRAAVWGLISPKHTLVINARAETVMSRPMFREAFYQRRCVIPADGFFEWQGTAKQRRPVWFHAPDGQVLPLAGVYDEEPDGTLRFTIVTTDANDVVAPVHDRMPVVLPKDAVSAWLAAPHRELLVPAAHDRLDRHTRLAQGERRRQRRPLLPRAPVRRRGGRRAHEQAREAPAPAAQAVLGPFGTACRRLQDLC